MKKNSLLEILTSQTKSDNLSHAYLVLGSILIEEIVNLWQIKPSDLLILEENPIKIDHIRQLIHWVHLKPHSSLRKLVVIGNINNMTLDAANSLLKVLEEPPESNIIILQSEKKEGILPTIISRCQIVREINFANTEESENDFLSIVKIAPMPIFERFAYINSIVADKDKENVKARSLSLINFWESEYREKLLLGEDCRQNLEAIQRARRLLLTNTSVKLLLENLIMDF